MSAMKDLVSSPPKRPSSPPPPASTAVLEAPGRKRRRKAEMNRVGFSIPADQDFDTVDWLFDGPYRRVPPYFYTYHTWAKLRWHNVSLLQVFCSEFRDRQPEYYKAAIENGSVKVNGQTAGIDYKIQNGDCISHTIHRHEPPVSSRPVRILHHDTNRGLLVIDKPAGIPVHAAGRYHKNSLISILRIENGFQYLAPLNRLDRLTSGIMLLGLTSEIAAKMSLQFQQRTMFKEYYCRVVGKFPEGEVVVDKAILVVSPRHGLNRLREGGKPSTTKFERLFYDEDRDQSVVLAKPLTGRTHQIRVHLQHLGHPIANDPIYANPQVFKTIDEASTATDEELIARLEKMGKSVSSSTRAEESYPNRNITPVHGLENPETREMWSGELCDVCGTHLYLDPAPGELEIWLHAWKYSWKVPAAEGTEEELLSFQSEVPPWGKEEWTGSFSRPRSPSVTPQIRMVEEDLVANNITVVS